ncbi:MAG: fibronectin type III domain-containing protein [Nitrospira sp.]|nr:MAG: fibronectin type III domain-containing protein [Nitrospira sp.]
MFCHDPGDLYRYRRPGPACHRCQSHKLVVYCHARRQQPGESNPQHQHVNTSTAILGNNTGTVTISGGGISRIVNVTLTLNAPATSSLTLAWNASTASDLAGYKIYRSTISGTYGSPLATLQGNVTSYTATGLTVNTTYFFVITAYDLAGNESAFSNEVSRSTN